MSALRDRGFDLGVAGSIGADARVDAIYDARAPRALRRRRRGVIRDASPRSVRVRTTATRTATTIWRIPQAGERLRDDERAGGGGAVSGAANRRCRLSSRTD